MSLRKLSLMAAAGIAAAALASSPVAVGAAAESSPVPASSAPHLTTPLPQSTSIRSDATRSAVRSKPGTTPKMGTTGPLTISSSGAHLTLPGFAPRPCRNKVTTPWAPMKNGSWAIPR